MQWTAKPSKEQAIQAAREVTTFLVERLNAVFASEGIAVTCRIDGANQLPNGGNFTVAMDGLTPELKPRVDPIIAQVLDEVKKFSPSGKALN